MKTFSLLTISNKRLRLLFVVVVFVFISVASFTFTNNGASAADSGFKAGNIIGDNVFTNNKTMNVSQIQNFLNSKVPICDTNGTQVSEYGGGTRAQWGMTKYNQSTFICLKDYQENGLSAAQIIYNTSQTYNINPQVLIVLLQKEQGLVTDTWPLNIQYRSATGYGCPDTAACDSQYYGLTNQVVWSAKMFHAIMTASSTWYTPYVLGNNYIQYSPNSSCGGSTLTIENRATQSLYNYTPYQPNSAALATTMGATVNCGAYGNLNFYRYFISWFGSTQQTLPQCDATAGNTICVWRLLSTAGYQYLTTSIDTRNALIGNGYTFQGLAFYARTTKVPNSIPTYEINMGQETLWTTSTSERDSLLAQGSVNKGIVWYVDSPDANSGSKIYRLYGEGKHILTQQVTERDQLILQGYSVESVAFTAPGRIVESWAPNEEKSLVYRLYEQSTGVHIWTTNFQEREALLESGSYNYEGVGWTSESTTGVPIYRLYEQATGKHFWTTNILERDVLLRSGFNSEGVGWYEKSTNTTPVYRLFERRTGKHFWTTNILERDVLLRSGFNSEGVGWYE